MPAKAKIKPATFPVVVQPDVLGGYWASCPTLQGCYSQGESIEETLENIRKAIALCLDDLSIRERQAINPDVSIHIVSL